MNAPIFPISNMLRVAFDEQDIILVYMKIKTGYCKPSLVKINKNE